MNHKLFFFLLLLAQAGCGVRGQPLPPETPPLLGRGSPSFSKATEKVTLPPKKKSSRSDDWNESEDFAPGDH